MKAAALAASADFFADYATAGEEQKPSAEATSRGLVDVNVYLSRWPCRRVPCDETDKLVARLRRSGVRQAWAGSLDSLTHKDVAAVNARLASECRERGEGILVPVGSVNPALPGWEEELRRCGEKHHMPGVRLHPNYHGYKLDDPAFARLLESAARRGMIVQLALCMEDRRTMRPRLRAAAVDLSPLKRLVEKTPGLRLMLLNASNSRSVEQLLNISAAGETYIDTAMLEGPGCIERLLKKIPLCRLCFGSYAPMFYFESAMLKLKESELSDKQSAAIRWNNAQRLLS